MEQNIFTLIIVTLFIPAALRKVLLFSYWWQVKEYRFDRIRVFLGMKEGKRVFFPLLFWLKLLFIPLFFIYPSLTSGVLIFYLSETLGFLIEILRRTVRHPVLTLRGWELVGTGVAFVVIGMLAIVILGGVKGLLAALITDVALLLFAPLAILWTAPLVWKTKVQEIKKARLILERVSPRIVAITGSFGKTSTKEFAASILSERFNVAKTQGSENTEFGIARKAQKNIKEGTEIFVAEMGAYKRGEIRKLCKIAPPKIGVITAIGNQHLALFGSKENIARAKYEVIEALPRDGIAIFNGNSPYCLSLAKQEQRTTYVYTTAQHLGRRLKELRPNIHFVYGRNIKAEKRKLSFTLVYQGKVARITVPLLGAHFVQNILGAATVGIALGMNVREIVQGTTKITPVPRTMEPKTGPGGSFVVDDSYSTGFHGFMSALDWLVQVPAARKFVVTAGIIELGEESFDAHKKLGRKLAEVSDLVILTNKEYLRPLGIGLGKRFPKLMVPKGRLFDYFVAGLRQDDIVLIEGRIPDMLRMRLLV